MTNQEQYERVWSKAEDYDRLKEQVLTSEKVYEAHIKRLEAENAELREFAAAAYRDMVTVMTEEKCKVCGLDYCNAETVCRWRYEEWAKKLIGGMENG